MHKCKATKDELVELALSRTDQNQLPTVELEGCSACREEFASWRNALRTTEAAIDLGQPEESFWPGYHQRLRERLERELRTSKGWLPPSRFNFLLWLRRVATTSIPVPVPVVSAVFVFLVFTIFLMMNSRQSSAQGHPLPSVITEPLRFQLVWKNWLLASFTAAQAPPRELIGASAMAQKQPTTGNLNRRSWIGAWKGLDLQMKQS